MTSHTPGPWRWVREQYNVSADKDHYNGSIVSAESWFIAAIDDAPEFEANARLIAAAPEMLEALKRIAGYVKSGISTNAISLASVHAAIAKAEGTTP